MYRIDSSVTGVLSSFFALSVWTLLVVYYTFFPNLDAIAITAYRVVWSLIFIAILITITGQWRVVRTIIRDRRQLLLLILCGLLLGVNWLSFIFAIVMEKPVEASLGSYLIPMFGLAAAVLVFKEHASFLKKIAMLLTVTGVIYLIAIYGKVPWYAFGISVSFMLYGAVHKFVTVNVMDGFFLEMLVLIAPSLVYLTFAPGVVPFHSEPLNIKLMIMMFGPLSSLSLIAFAFGIKRLSFSTVSFIQYIYPTLTFLLGIFYFKEPLGGRLPAFIFIWTGVIIYLFDTMLRSVTFKRKISNL